MLRTNLDAWKAALYVSLGLGTGACGGRQDPGEDTAPADTTAAEEGASESTQPMLQLPQHLRCEGETPSLDDPNSHVCDNGIIHRTAPAEAEVCEGEECPLVGPALHPAGDLCASDDDCRPGALCILSRQQQRLSTSCPAPTTGTAYWQTVEFWACQAPEDQCGADAQCAAGQICAAYELGRQCAAYSPFPCGVPGRPFLIGAEARVASAVPRTDWCEPSADTGELDAAARAELGRHWREAALMEHASIAAFARFTLQLLQLGAPYDLVLESQRAMLDETEHARRCFSLAARYAGTPEGPGPLSIAGALREQSLATILRLTFREGCVGETVAALEAAEALAEARDPEVRRTLELITRDERRHAALAWRVVAWALDRDTSGEVRQTLHAELQRLRTMTAPVHASPRDDDATPHPALAWHGRSSAERRNRLEKTAIAELVVPCTERLLASRVAGASQGVARPPAQH